MGVPSDGLVYSCILYQFDITRTVHNGNIQRKRRTGFFGNAEQETCIRVTY